MTPAVVRLFVAAWPDPPTVAVLRRLPRPTDDDVRPVPPSNWHVTLRFLGDGDADEVAARLATAELPACHARLGPSVTTLGPQLVVPVTGVDALAAAVRAATDGIGGPDRRPFRGHLTLARLRRGATSRSGRRSGPRLEGLPVDASFDVGEVALVRSELTHDGPRYTTIATFATR